MWQFVEACQGIAAACEAFNTPVVSGNVSFYNETNGVSIFPTPMIGMVGVMRDLAKRVPSAFQAVGDIVIVLGETRGELGGSEYVKQVTGEIRGACPELDFIREKQLWKTLQDLHGKDWLRSAHDLSEGGLWLALVECCEALNVGFKGEINSPLRADSYLFGESQSRVLISVTKKNVPDVLEFLKAQPVPFLFLGEVRSARLTLFYNGKPLIDADHQPFIEAYRTGFEKHLFERK
jgi:phosphoribosylformylglycinamidine synthase